jgi:hypothetical protein
MHGRGESRRPLYLLLFAFSGLSCWCAHRYRHRVERGSGAVILPRAAIRSCQRLSHQTRRSACLEQQRAFFGNFAWIPYWRRGRRNRRLRHDFDNLRRHSFRRLYNKLDRCPRPDATPDQPARQSYIAAMMGSGGINSRRFCRNSHGIKCRLDLTKPHKSECRDRFRTIIGRYVDEGLVKVCLAAKGWTLLRVKQLLHGKRVRRRVHRNFAAGLSPPNRSRLEFCGIGGGLSRLRRTLGAFRQPRVRRSRALKTQLTCRFRLLVTPWVSPA